MNEEEKTCVHELLGTVQYLLSRVEVHTRLDPCLRSYLSRVQSDINFMYIYTSEVPF